MINDVKKKQPYREDLLREDDDDSQTEYTPYSKNRFPAKFDEPGNEQTPAQIRQNRTEKLLSQIWKFRSIQDVDEVVRILFSLRGEYHEARDCLVMKKSLFSKLVLSRLKVSSKQEEQKLRAKIDVYLRNVASLIS